MKEINPTSLELLQEHLLPDETVLWSDKPARIERVTLIVLLFMWILFGVLLIYPVAYALLTGNFSILNDFDITFNGEQIDQTTSKAKLVSMLIGFLILLTGMSFMLMGLAFFNYRQVYAITTFRILLKRRFPFFTVATILLQHVNRFSRTGSKSIGTITIFDANDGLIDKILRLYQVKQSILHNIPNPEIAERILAERIEIEQKAKS